MVTLTPDPTTLTLTLDPNPNPNPDPNPTLTLALTLTPELIRLYGINRLAEAGEEGHAGLATWRRRLVQHTTRWLREQDRCFQSAAAEVCPAHPATLTLQP